MTPSVPVPRADKAMLLSPVLKGPALVLTASEEPGIVLSPSGIDVRGWRPDRNRVD